MTKIKKLREPAGFGNQFYIESQKLREQRKSFKAVKPLSKAKEGTKNESVLKSL